MSIERFGRYIEFVADEGARTLVRVSAVQIVAEADPLGQEVMITVANRTFRVDASLDEMREVLIEDETPSRWSSSRPTRGANCS